MPKSKTINITLDENHIAWLDRVIKNQKSSPQLTRSLLINVAVAELKKKLGLIDHFKLY